MTFQQFGIISSAILFALSACDSGERDFSNSEDEDGDISGVTSDGGTAAGSGGTAPAAGGAAIGAGGSASTGGAASVGGSTMSSGGAADAAGGAEMGSGGAASGGSGSGGGSGGEPAGVGGGVGGTEGSGGAAGGGEFLLSSPSWTAANNDGCTAEGEDEDCERFPKEHVADSINGDNLSPELNWANPPEGTMGFVLVLHDLSNGFGHWAAWNMDASFTGLPASLGEGSPLSDPEGLEQTGITGASYFGSGACGNTYEFRLYALSISDYAPSGQAAAGDIRDELDASSDLLGTAFVRLRSGEPYCTP